MAQYSEAKRSLRHMSSAYHSHLYDSSTANQHRVFQLQDYDVNGFRFYHSTPLLLPMPGPNNMAFNSNRVDP
jgi:hypothetical protein